MWLNLAGAHNQNKTGGSRVGTLKKQSQALSSLDFTVSRSTNFKLSPLLSQTLSYG